MQTKIENIIFQALKNIGEENDNELLKHPNLETKIYGVEVAGAGGLDSLALVSFITDVEAMLSEIGIDIVLADEKAMSGRNSPFKDVQSLRAYIIKKCEENV